MDNNNTDQTDFEWHLPGMNFCGPGTDLNARLNEDGTPKVHSMPVDRVDEAALRHDKFYGEHHTMKERLRGDKQMLDEINAIENPTCRECLERFLVNVVFRTKAFFAPLLELIVRLVELIVRLWEHGGGFN